MKTLYLVWNFFKSSIKNNRLVMILFFIGVFLSSLMFIYFYGNSSSTNGLLLGNGDVFKTYSIQVMNQDQTVLEEYISWLEQQNLDKIVFCSNVELDPLNANIELLSSGALTIQSRKDDQIRTETALGRGEFTEEEINQGKNVIILSIDQLPLRGSSEGILGETIQLDGVDYEIIGVSNYSRGPFIPYRSFLKSEFSLDTIDITLDEVLLQDESEEFVEYIQNSVPGILVQSPYDVYSNYLNQPQDHVILLILYFAASLILFLFLMKYILDSSRYEYIVYSICGASRGTVINLMYIEVFCSSVVASLAAVVVHRLFYNVFFDKINMLQGLRYRFIDYLLIMLFICIAILICSIPFIVSYYKKGLIASKNQYQ